MAVFIIGSRRAVPAAKLMEKLLSSTATRSAASAGRFFTTDDEIHVSLDNERSLDADRRGKGSVAGRGDIDDFLLPYNTWTSSRLTSEEKEKSKREWWNYDQKSQKQSK